jgi:putative glutamine amidotransferase
MPGPAFRPLIGISADADADRYSLRQSYIDAVIAAGGLPVILPCRAELAADFVARCDGILLSGGDDPHMEHWGQTTHPRAKPMHPDRQAFEIALLRALDQRPQIPTLGVCLGMQLMGLHAGGSLNQHLPDTLPTAEDHRGGHLHAVQTRLGQGAVASFHHQALTDAGVMQVIGTSADGVIEAVQRPDRPFYLGVQWHPERTNDPQLGVGVIRRLVEAAAAGRFANSR